MHFIMNKLIVVAATVGNVMHTSAACQNISITLYMARCHVRTDTKASLFQYEPWPMLIPPCFN
ncbi:hypothetical protein PF008_g6655 [Phytophthora fragariae]|uniref:Secreted protein n=1 Tax=Phytophthora fragariae TaxID=53985 RepID=A0A6G0S6K4_9STRA|nr:hypothetical protein PF008_g6655 [Phytophthora fragariae]